MTNALYQQFFNLLQSNSPSLKDGELLMDIGLVKSDEIKNLLESVGYIFDDVRTVRRKTLHISLNAAQWTNDAVIFNSWADLFSIVTNSSYVPEYFYIIEPSTSSFDESNEKKQLLLFCLIRKLLVALSDHCEPNQGNAKGSKKLFLIIETDDGVAKYEFSPQLIWSDLSSIDVDDQKVNLVKKLIELTQLGDSQDSERRAVMRSAFHELISSCHDENEIFAKFIGSVAHFNKRYEEHHELFVRRFSINKVLHEINEQDLTYTSKINEIISSAQNKALAVPGALIVIGAVMKIDQYLDGIAVAIGIIMTTIIVQRSLGVYKATFEHISKQVKSEFKRYDVLNEKVEIREQAKQTKKDLSGLIKKANNNAGFMTASIWAICIFALCFIYSVTSKISVQEISKASGLPSKALIVPKENEPLNKASEATPPEGKVKEKKVDKSEVEETNK